MIVRAISLWEPWASLIMTGAKKFETRSWATAYRGPLVICAAQGGLPKREVLEVIQERSFKQGLAPLAGEPLDFLAEPQFSFGIADLNFGKALCVVDLDDCLPTNDFARGDWGTDLPFGNFDPYRYAWTLDNLRVFADPFPVKGKQGFFNVDISGRDFR